MVIQPPHPYTGYSQCSTFRTISSLILQFYELLLYDEIMKQKAGHRERKYVRHHTQFSSTMYNMH